MSILPGVDERRAAAAMLGRLGGLRRTPAQTEARRLNGRKGGRPAKATVEVLTGHTVRVTRRVRGVLTVRTFTVPRDGGYLREILPGQRHRPLVYPGLRLTPPTDGTAPVWVPTRAVLAATVRRELDGGATTSPVAG